MSSTERLLLAHDLETYPGISRFALDLVRRQGDAGRFFSRTQSALEPLSDTPGRDEIARELIEMNRSWGNDVASEVERWRRGGAVTIVAGQQVGFGGGPLYTLTKIASLINLRERCRREGNDAVVFFWMATEDHDFLEVASLTLPHDGATRTLRAAERPDQGRAVGNLTLPRTLAEQLRRHEPALAGGWCDPALSFRDSFAILLSSVLAGRGVILVDSLMPSLRRAGSQLFVRVANEWNAAQETLGARDAEIRAAGYAPQVHGDGDHALLWLIDRDGYRHAVRRIAGDRFGAGDEELSAGELVMRIEQAPERVSTGALLRPVLQDRVFGTDVFVGGPAEVSYYAQSESLHQRFGVRAPKVMLRGHALVSPVRPLEKALQYGVRLEELYETPVDVLSRRESDAIDRWTQATSSAARIFRDEIEAASTLPANAASEMGDSIARSLRRISYHVTRMQERGARAIARRDAQRARAVERAHAIIAPDGIPQDRRISWLPYHARWKRELLDALADCAVPDTSTVAIIGLQG